MRKEEFWKKIWKKWWLKKEQAVCMIWWTKNQNYFDDQNWLLIYKRNSDDKLDSIIAI